MTVRGFFFDLDGTLVDTHESNFRSYRQAIEETTGLTLGNELKERIRSGESSEVFLRALLTDVNDKTVARINHRKKELYPQHLDTSILNTYLSSFLEQMSEHYTTALLTTAKRDNALAVIKKHGLERHFTFMLFGDDVDNMKPHPEVYTRALERSGLEANEVIAFEDSPKGLASAEAAGILTIHIKGLSQ